MSNILIEDTRNQKGKHKNVHEWAKANGVAIIRTKLLVGDYTLPTDQRVIIDTKKDMQEVYGDIVQDHERFRAECELAQKAGILLTVLVEEPGIEGLDGVKGWKNPRRDRWFRVHAAHKAGKLMKVTIPKVPPHAGTAWRTTGHQKKTAPTLCMLLHTVAVRQAGRKEQGA